MKVKTVYCLPGLGADHRLFSRLHLPEGINIKCIDWIKNLPDETVADYAKRLAKEINTSEPFSLIGVSFGGVVSLEIARQLSPQHVIIISSFMHHNELPAIYRI